MKHLVVVQSADPMDSLFVYARVKVGDKTTGFLVRMWAVTDDDNIVPVVLFEDKMIAATTINGFVGVFATREDRPIQPIRPSWPSNK